MSKSIASFLDQDICVQCWDRIVALFLFCIDMHKCLCEKVTGNKVTFRSLEVGCFLVIICCRLSVIISVFLKTLQDSYCMHSGALKNSH